MQGGTKKNRRRSAGFVFVTGFKAFNAERQTRSPMQI
jgi:hypothetical protein